MAGCIPQEVQASPDHAPQVLPRRGDDGNQPGNARTGASRERIRATSCKGCARFSGRNTHLPGALQRVSSNLPRHLHAAATVIAPDPHGGSDVLVPVEPVFPPPPTDHGTPKLLATGDKRPLSPASDSLAAVCRRDGTVPSPRRSGLCMDDQSSCKSLPMLHRRTAPLSLAAASQRPSGENATERNPAIPSPRLRTSWPRRNCQTRTRPSGLAAASRLPAGEKASASIFSPPRESVR